MVDAARGAAADSGSPQILERLDGLTVVRQFSDTLPRFASPFGRIENPPWSIAQAIGADPAELLHTTAGGHTPQVVVTRFCEEIAAGRLSCAMIVGAEPLRTQRNAAKKGVALDWHEEAPEAPASFGIERASFSPLEDKYGLNAAIYGYPVVEQAIRSDRGDDPKRHAARMGQLMARLASVARDNPLATRRWGPDAQEIATPSDRNPYIGFPYTRLMNANVFVDQAAAIILCSATMADSLDIPEQKRVYLHGAAAGNDHWYVSERDAMHRSPAIRAVTGRTLERAGLTVGEIDHFDLYSCFPSAIEIACRELGLDEDDPRNITVTGGLPFFGGPGNNYVTHSIATMVGRVRATPGSFGLVTANGSYLAKHAAGVYSTTPLAGPWEQHTSDGLQESLDKVPKAPLIDGAAGPARIESYTLAFGRNGPEKAIVFARLIDGNQRFLANTARAPEVLQRFLESDMVGAEGTAQVVDGKSEFTLTGK